MSNTEELKKYLLEKENAFLLDETNNGKTIMLSGAWGAGKTHFWKEEIVREQEKVQQDGKEVDKYNDDEYKKGLHSKLKEKEKACIYVSLYGKDSLDSLKKEIYIKASSEKELISKEVSTFGFDALSSIKDSDLKIGQALKAGAGAGIYTKYKSDKGIKRLKDGGVICLDDFERKSKQIDLNDLFGFISQLAIEMNCKIVIILNSDVFIGKEAEVFSNVKEKTVNKFFYFKPSIEELFKSISDDEKYNPLEDYKANILKSIKETEELNARVYIQVLDNCLEWLNVREVLDENIVRVLVLGTFNFVLNHMVLDYQRKCPWNYGITNGYRLQYQTILFPDNINIRLKNQYSNNVFFIIEDQNVSREKKNVIAYTNNKISDKVFIEKIKNSLSTKSEWIKENEQQLKALWKYGYQLHYVADVEEETYNEIAQFIKSGILI